MMKKKIFATLLLVMVCITIVNANICVDIYNGCIDGNPYDPENGVHEAMAWMGYESGCHSFLNACMEQD